jgi:hypothetical protein
MREDGKTHLQIANHFADKGLVNQTGRTFQQIKCEPFSFTEGEGKMVDATPAGMESSEVVKRR